MPAQDPKIAAGCRRLDEIFGSRFGHLLWQLTHYARTGQSFDAVFFDREPILDVTLDDIFASKFLDDARSLRRLCKRVKFSDGTIAPIDAIWLFNYMPRDGIDNAALDNVDLAQAEVRAGQNGETIREMIRVSYRCASTAEEDFFVRRFIAS
jgi:hypothetical protein